MKKIILAISLLISAIMIAQPLRDGKLKERIKAQKTAFITSKLNLTNEEAQKFWPIYNEFETTLQSIRNGELRTIKQRLKNNPNMDDKEANVLLEKLITAEDNRHNAKVKLIKDLKGVIPTRKIIKLKRVEDEFNRKLLERLKEFKHKRRK